MLSRMNSNGRAANGILKGKHYKGENIVWRKLWVTYSHFLQSIIEMHLLTRKLTTKPFPYFPRRGWERVCMGEEGYMWWSRKYCLCALGVPLPLKITCKVRRPTYRKWQPGRFTWKWKLKVAYINLILFLCYATFCNSLCALVSS